MRCCEYCGDKFPRALGHGPCREFLEECREQWRKLHTEHPSLYAKAEALERYCAPVDDAVLDIGVGDARDRLRVAGSAIPGNICRECGWSKVKCTCRSAKPPTKSQLRDYAQSQIKAHTAMLGFPRRYEVMVYSDKAHWDAGVAHHDYLYEATWPEAKKRIAANQVLDVFVYTEMTPDDTFGELNDVVTIDLARYGNDDPPASDRWLCRNRGGL